MHTRPVPLAWMHVPKTGTSFGHAVMHVAGCTRKRDSPMRSALRSDERYMRIDDYVATLWRCPTQRVSADWRCYTRMPMSMPRRPAANATEPPDRLHRGAHEERGLVPMDEAVAAAAARGIKMIMTPPSACDNHRPYDAALDRGGAVALFRRPAQRTMSEFTYLRSKAHTQCCKDDWGLPGGERRQRLLHRLMANGSSAFSDADGAPLAPMTAAAYASQPGMRGCQTKMVLGHHCLDVLPPPQEEEENVLNVLKVLNVSEARRRLRDDFLFVGLVEHWGASVCLLHATTAGAPARPPPAYAFANGRPTARSVSTATGTAAATSRPGATSSVAPKPYDEAELAAAGPDDADDAVYDEAARIFSARLRQHWASPRMRECCGQPGVDCHAPGSIMRSLLLSDLRVPRERHHADSVAH